MAQDRIKGKGKEAVGTAKQKVGELTGDEETQARGAAQRAEGKAQGAMGKAKDAAGDVKEKAKEKLER